MNIFHGLHKVLHCVFIYLFNLYLSTMIIKAMQLTESCINVKICIIKYQNQLFEAKSISVIQNDDEKIDGP